jgi:hypothetical protein
MRNEIEEGGINMENSRNATFSISLFIRDQGVQQLLLYCGRGLMS